MARLLEFARGDGPLDTWVRALTLGILLLLMVALVGTTLLLRNPDREDASTLLVGDDLATIGTPLHRSTP